MLGVLGGVKLVKLMDKEYMSLALLEAKKAALAGEVPVGAVIVNKAGEILASAYNQKELYADATCHAEILAIKKAAAAIGNWCLADCTIYATLEPCPMCAGAILNARLKRLVYATDDIKAGGVYSVFNILTHARLNHKVQVTVGVGEEESRELLRDFFSKKR